VDWGQLGGGGRFTTQDFIEHHNMTKPLLLQVLITAQFLIEYNEGLTTFAFSGETVHTLFLFGTERKN